MMALLSRLVPPWAWAAIAVTLLAAAFGAGWKVRAWRCEAARIELVERQQKQFDRQLAQQQRESEAYERDQLQARDASRRRETEIRTIYRDVPVPAECEPPADVRSVLDDSVRAANARAAGQSGGTVPSDPGAS